MNQQAATLRLAVWPRSGLLTDAALVVGGAGLIAACAQISFNIPHTPVPVTGQTFAVVLVGAGLGMSLGAASGLLYLLAGLALPIYASHAHGFSTISGPSGGYLIGMPIAALLTGYLAERRWDRRFSSAVGAMLTGNVVIYAVALPWLYYHLPHTSIATTLSDGLYPFVPGDTLKLYLAAAALPSAWKLVGKLRS